MGAQASEKGQPRLEGEAVIKDRTPKAVGAAKTTASSLIQRARPCPRKGPSPR